MIDHSAKLRAFYARFVTARAGARDPRVEAAFAAVPREVFVGPGPRALPVFPPGGPGLVYVDTPDDDPAFLYSDVLVALDRSHGVNNGEPSLHARCLDALALRPGETVLHVGAGTGYYTALLAHLVAPGGCVHAYEIDPDLAARAATNLSGTAGVEVHARSGIAADLPAADAIYVNAALSAPSRTWLDALQPGGRLLFPLQAGRSLGGMLLVTRPTAGGSTWPARFVSRAVFIRCDAPTVQDDEALASAFAGGGWEGVRALHLDGRVEDGLWYRGDGWALSSGDSGSLHD